MGRTLLRWVGWLSLFAVLGLLITAGLLYFAVGHEPEFYRAQVTVDPVAQQRASDELIAKTAAATSTARRAGEWSLELTDQQINGWLAVALPLDEPLPLQEIVREPRVQFRAGRATVAARYVDHGVDAVLSLECDLSMTEPGELAVRVRSFKCGALPIPMQRILDLVSEHATDAGWRIRWSQQDGDPVAHVKLPPFQNDGAAYQLETIEITDGSLKVSARRAADAAARSFELRHPLFNGREAISGR